MTGEQADFRPPSLTKEITLPAKLSKIKKADNFPALKYRWNNNEEVLSFLISFDNHERWITFSTPKRPENGSMLLYNRKKTKDYRKDGYLWKKRKSNNTTREDHFKLKVDKIECLNALYTHSALVPTFHRRCYWLLENPDIILVHYLNFVEECTSPQTISVQAHASKFSKEDISRQLDTIYSGISHEVKPDVQVTEATASTDLSSSPENNDKIKGKGPLNWKVFTISITPPTKQELPVNAQDPGTCSNGTNGMLDGSGTANVFVNLFNLPGDLPSLFPCTSNNSLQTQASFPLFVGSTSQQTQPITSSGLYMCNPIVGFPSTSQQTQPISSSGLFTCSAIGNLTSQEAQPVSSSVLHTCNPVGSYLSTSPQTQPISSCGLSTSNPISGSSSSSQQAQPISSSDIYTCNAIVGFPSTLQQTLPMGSSYVPTSGNSPSIIGQQVRSQLPVSSFGLQTELDRANSVVVLQKIARSTSTSSSGASKPVEIAPKPLQQEPCFPRDTQINAQLGNLTDSTFNGFNLNAVPTGNISSSPSSDYGSYISDPGNNASAEGVREGLFDGPFRVPHPIGQEIGRNGQSPQLQRVLSARRGSVAESSGSSASSSSRSSSQEASVQQLRSKTNGTSLAASSTDSDAGIDLTDLQDFPPFELHLLGADLCLNLPGDGFADTNNFSVKEASMCDPLGQSSNFLENSENFTEISQCFAGNNGNFSGNSCSAPCHDSSVLPMAHNTVSTATAKQSDTCLDSPFVFPPVVLSPVVTPAAYFPDASKAPFSATTTSHVTGLVSNAPSPHTKASQGIMDVNMVDVQATSSEPAISGKNVFLSTVAQLQPQSVSAQTVNCVSGSHTDSCGSQAQRLVPRPPNHVVPVSARIIEYSPEWSYPEGGTKVLVTGEWSVMQDNFTCLFDGCSVQATLIHPGVLRCFCPPHEPGLVTLQVACNGFIVSNACVFEYRTRDSPTSSGAGYHEWLARDDTRFKLAVLDRLERLEARLFSGTASTADVGQIQHSLELEERLVKICATLFSAVKAEDASTREREKPYRGLTLLHLSAALGYSVLVVRLLYCRQETESETIKEELDPLRKDDFSCTPLMWACALGQTDTVMVLLEHEPNALLLADARGRLPLQIALDRGYVDVVQRIEDFVLAVPQRQVLLFGNVPEEPRAPGGTLEPLSVASSPMSAPSMSPLSAPPSNGPMEPMSVESMTSECSSEDPESVPVVGRLLMYQANTLGKALTQVRSMINKAEQEAEMEQNGSSGWSHRVCGPLRENSELVTSPSSWKTAGRMRSFSSTSPQGSPLTSCSSRSSLSPGSPGFLSSPHSSTGGAPDTAEFEEFISSSRRLLERDFSDLTLTDREQQELYEAAKIIQSAYRNYKVRRHQQEQEIQAAILIQHQYRRYKQYVVTKKKTQAARIIQNQFRAHREHEHFLKSRQAAAIIQNHFRIYRERRRSQRRREESKNKRQEARFMKQFSNRAKENP